MCKYIIYSTHTAGLEFAKVIQKTREVRVITPDNTPCKKNYLDAFGSRVIFFSNINDEELYSLIAAYNPNIIAACVFSAKIPNNHIALAKKLAVNFHPSRLPGIRTGDSSFWNIMLEHDSYCYSIHKLTSQWDCGEIIYVNQLPLDPRATSESFIETARLHLQMNSEKYMNILEQYQTPSTVFSEGLYYPKQQRDSVYLTLQESGNYIERLVRACNPEIKVIVKFRDFIVRLMELKYS